MKTIAVISQKGGSGKTTLSLNLAIAAAADGRQAVVIDLDPQQSAARWSRLRTADNPVILSGHAPNLLALIDKARDAGADLVIIDTAPKSESASLVAAKAADLILIPCQPSSLDLDAIADTVNIAKLSACASARATDPASARRAPGTPSTHADRRCHKMQHKAHPDQVASGVNIGRRSGAKIARRLTIFRAPIACRCPICPPSIGKKHGGPISQRTNSLPAERAESML